MLSASNVGVKLLQQSSPVVNLGCRLMQVILYNGRKTVVAVVFVVGMNVIKFTIWTTFLLPSANHLLMASSVLEKNIQ